MCKQCWHIENTRFPNREGGWGKWALLVSTLLHMSGYVGCREGGGERANTQGGLRKSDLGRCPVQSRGLRDAGNWECGVHVRGGTARPSVALAALAGTLVPTYRVDDCPSALLMVCRRGVLDGV